VRAVQRGGLVDRVIDEVTAEIDSGTWTPGDRLPSVAELAESLGVGRSTVREAVGALAHRGVLEVHQGRGTFVAVPVEETGALWLRRAEVLDVYEARRGLEVDAARLAARRRDEDDLAAITAAADARHAARAEGAVSEWAAADLALHRAVFAATHNPVLMRLFSELAAAMTSSFEQQTDDPRSAVDTAHDHDALVAAITDRDPDAAVRATTGYLDACEDELRELLGAAR
jgi:DNA-binding FadR family transcriptional regulator